MFETIATNLPRLMNCNGSASMAGFTAAIDDQSADLRGQGIAAHELAVRLKAGHDVSTLIGKPALNGVFMTSDMLDAVDEYLDYISGRTPRGFYFSEMESDTSYCFQEFIVKGRADNIHHSVDDVLFIDDFKYGYRIVEPNINWTLISHALGYCFQRPNMTLPEQFVFSIIQPRATHPEGIVRQWTINRDYFVTLYEQIIATLSNLTSELRTGEHCRRCPSLVYCHAATKANLNAVEVIDELNHEQLNNDQLSETLDLLDTILRNAKVKKDALEEYAIHKLRNGEIVKNYLPEESLGNNTWKGNVTPNMMNALVGIDIRSDKMVTPNQAIKLGVPKNIVETMTARPKRGVKLKRMSANQKASKLFSHMKGE